MAGLHRSDSWDDGFVPLVRIWKAIMSKCAGLLEQGNAQSVATRVFETVVAGLLILMMAA
jgi:hypothetical protein